jgi:diguanylate cyclase (GGDEF)-like protein/hemerythrin-like metal-binding protein
MKESQNEWLAEPAVLGLLKNFPVPLAVLSPAGEPGFLNPHFLQMFDAQVLQAPALRALVAAAASAWTPVRLPDARGRPLEVQAHASRVGASAVLVIRETEPETSLRIRELHERVRELERLSSTDALTGAWNRAHLDRIIESELSRSARSKQPLSLLLFDIDHFKRVNDTHGHQAGDEVLRELVTVVKAHIRSADALFRWGGEEFLVLAAATGYRNAAVFAETLRAQVEKHVFPRVGHLSISVGVAEHLGSESAAVWFGRVDAAMYAAKEAGRNCVQVDRCGNSDAWLSDGRLAALRLVWQESYECGNAQIDGEHRELFVLANALIEVHFAEDRSPAATLVALDRLLAHIVQHFADEEVLLEKAGYARLEEHKRAHARLLGRAGDLRKAAETGELTLGALVDFLASDVVARHLFTADKDFFPLFAPGLAAA